MNYAARQRIDGRWDYAAMRDGQVRPVGYCAGYGGSGHQDGHSTAEEAYACYRLYLLDTARLDGSDASTRHRCRICGEWTDRYAVVGALGWYPLCPPHLNQEMLETLFPAVGPMVSSR